MFSISTSYTAAQENLATLLDQIEQEKAIAVIHRPGHKDMAVLAADELSGLLETVYLMRSPANARRLLEPLEQSKQWNSKQPKPQSIDKLCQDLEIERKKET